MITAHDFTPSCLELFTRSGWHPDRRVSISGWVDGLTREGFTVIPTASRLLESVGGLSVTMPPAGINPYEHILSLDPLQAATGDRDRAEAWELDLGIDLFPLGSVQPGGSVVWAGSDGRYFLGRGFGLYLLGDSFGSAMQRLAFPESSPGRCAD